MPSFVGEMRVGRYAIDFHAHFLELGVVVSQVTQLGGANKGEVGRIEKYHRPFAGQRGFRDRHKFAFVIGGGGEGLYFGVDQIRHLKAP